MISHLVSIPSCELNAGLGLHVPCFEVVQRGHVVSGQISYKGFDNSFGFKEPYHTIFCMASCAESIVKGSEYRLQLKGMIMCSW